MAELTTRKYENGLLVSEEKSEIDWELSEADLDEVTVGCKCGNKFDIPWDVVAFGALVDPDFYCGQCVNSLQMEVINDPIRADKNKKDGE